MARKTTAEIVLKGTDQASGAFNSVTKSAKGTGDAVEQSGEQATKAQGSFAKFTSFLKTRFVFTLQDVGRAVSAVFNAIKDASDLSSQTNALKLSLAQQGKDFDTYLATLKEVSRGTVSTADLIKSTSKALLLGIPADDIAKLLDVARASAIATGQSVTKAFDDIATGIGRASPLILDNLGIIVKIGKANEEYADKIGKTVEQLTAAEQKQALLNKVLTVGEERIALFGEAADKNTIAIQKAQAAMGDFRDVAGRLATGAVSVLAGTLTLLSIVVLRTASTFNRLRLSWNELTGDMEEAAGIRTTIDNLEELILSVRKTGLELVSGGISQFGAVFTGVATDTEAGAKRIADALDNAKNATDELGNAADNAEPKIVEMKDAMDETADVLDNDLLPAMTTLDTRLEATTRRAEAAAVSFDVLAASQGRAAAVAAQHAANLAAGDPTGGVSLRGTRIDIPGGSRLTRAPGFSNVDDANRRRPGDDAFSRLFLNS